MHRALSEHRTRRRKLGCLVRKGSLKNIERDLFIYFFPSPFIPATLLQLHPPPAITTLLSVSMSSFSFFFFFAQSLHPPIPPPDSCQERFSVSKYIKDIQVEKMMQLFGFCFIIICFKISKLCIDYFYNHERK